MNRNYKEIVRVSPGGAVKRSLQLIEPTLYSVVADNSPANGSDTVFTFERRGTPEEVLVNWELVTDGVTIGEGECTFSVAPDAGDVVAAYIP